MKPYERLRALVAEFSTDYVIACVADEDVDVIVSNASFGRMAQPLIEEKISKLEHKEKKREKREKQNEDGGGTSE